MLIGFFAALFVFGGVKQASAQTPKKAAVPAPNMSTPGFLIDSHIHYGANDAWEKSFLEIFTKWNAMGCVLVGMRDLDRGIAFAKAHPDRVIPYAAIDIDSPTALDDIQKAYDMGYKGLGELFARTDWNYDDPKNDKIWAMAVKLHLPIAPHTGILASGQMSRMMPGFLGTIAVKFPNLQIHAAHFGNPWYNEAGEIARRNKNLYFDMSGSSLIKEGENPSYWLQYLWWTPYLGQPHMPTDAVPAFQKIVFASDQSPQGLEENILRFNKMLDACGVPDDIRRKCYYETIAKMHGIDVSKYLKK
jgi:uncharacterized protein